MEKKYCAAPWRGLHVNFRGDIKTCCAGDPNMLGTLNDQTIEEALQSPLMHEIREYMQRGELHPQYCYNCIKAEQFGESERNWHNNSSPEFRCETAELTDYKPVIVDVRWNITCNLSCNYCNEWASSKWAGHMGTHVDNGVKPYAAQVGEFMASHADSIKEVALVGGEPLLLKENIDVLKGLSDDTLVTVITNVSVDFDNNKIVDLLTQRRNVNWSMSFDNVGDHLEYVRHGTSKELLHKNATFISNLIKSGQHHGGIHAVYNIYNCTRLCELRDYADALGVQIHWQTLHHPECLDVSKHSRAIRELALDEIKRYKNNYELSDHEEAYFDGVQNHLWGIIGGDNPQGSALQMYTFHMEEVYHPDTKGQFEKLWPEIHNLL